MESDEQHRHTPGRPAHNGGWWCSECGEYVPPDSESGIERRIGDLQRAAAAAQSRARLAESLISTYHALLELCVEYICDCDHAVCCTFDSDGICTCGRFRLIDMIDGVLASGTFMDAESDGKADAKEECT